MLAAMNGHVPAVKLLLDMGSDINAQIETNRNTALTLACFQGRAEVVSLLLDRKANVEHRAKVRGWGGGRSGIALAEKPEFHFSRPDN